MLVEQELMDAAIPGSNFGEELLEAFDAAVGEGGKALIGPIEDLDHLAIVDLVRISAGNLDELEALIDHFGNQVNAVNAGDTHHRAAFSD
ncbi:MAG: hypothetical protein ACR2RE_24360 [Geminicoccaceae bacterium]